MLEKTGILQGFYCLVLLLCSQLAVNSALGSLNYEGSGPASVGTVAPLMKKEERTPVVSTEFGSVSAVDIDDGTGRNNFNLQFITLEPNALFLPVLLHADMVFYVHTGSGTLSWTEGDDINKVSLQRGDVYRLKSGTLFYLYSSLEPERPRFRIIAIFANPDQESLQGPSVGPYSSINDLVRGFDKRVLQAAFQVPEEVIEEITSTTDTPAIVHAESQRQKRFWEDDNLILNAFFGTHRFGNHATDNKKKHKHTKTFNFFKEDPDFQNCNGWSKVVTNHDLHALHGSKVGVYMVNLTKGSMMGPHWNPTASEVSVVLDGEGMVRVVCPSSQTNKDCKNTRIRVEEGDVFAIPRFHPMAQTSFNNGSLVFMGFSTTSKRNHPQFLAGKASVFQILDKPVLRASFNVSNTTIDQMLSAQEESIILECISCAEEQEMLMEEELERGRQEEERKHREEEARRREEEERRRQEEEAERRREEEQRRQQEEEERRRQKEEEEAERKREEEQRRQQVEEERRRQKEEEERRRQEEEEQKRREEEEERGQEEEEQRWEKEERQQQEEEQRRREKEERQQQEEEQRRQEEEQRQPEEEEQRRREKEERQRQEEQRREEEQRRQEEEEEERTEQEEEERTEQEEEERRREQESEEERQQQEEERRQRRQEEEEQQQEEERGRPGRREEEEQGRAEEESEGEIARREEEERVRRQREEAGRWRDVKLIINKQTPKGKKAYNGGRFWRVKPNQDVPW